MADKTFGTPSKALEAEKYFVDILGYKQVRPVKVTVSQPSGRKQISCYGLEYVRPEFSDEVWLYLLIDYVDFKSIYKRPHYYRRYLPPKDRTYAKGKFIFDGEDWYITGYTTEDSLSEQYIQFHPFGYHIGMRAWTGDCLIDYYESKKPRLVMEVDELSEDDNES